MPTAVAVRSVARHRVSRRGGTFAIILLVLAAIFLVVAIIGFLYSRSSLGKVTADAKRIAGNATIVAVPGTATIDAQGGALLIGALSPDKVDGKEVTFPKGGGVTITVKDSSGGDVRVQTVDAQSGASNVIPTENGELHMLGWAEIPGAGTFTVTTEGPETAVRVAAVSKTELEGLFSGVIGMGVGFGGGVCGGLGFVLFGIIGGLLFLFGRKKQPALPH